MKTIEQRFLDKVIIPEDKQACWEWQARRNNSGYGTIKVNGKTVVAHRISYLMFNVGDPTGLVVRHTCDNRGCVNPDHLLIGTQADNMKDAVERTRFFNQRKTHCPQGHEFNKVNSENKRICTQCRNEYVRKWNKLNDRAGYMKSYRKKTQG